jgi:DNA primase
MSSIEDIKRSKTILDVCGELGIQVYRGNKIRCFNPGNHNNNDENPSVAIFPDTNTYKCFVCNEKRGDVIDLVMGSQGITMKDAMEWLGVVKVSQNQTPLKQIKRKSLSEKANKEDLDAFWKACVTQDFPSEVFEWVESLGVTKDLFLKMGCGYIKDYNSANSWIKKRGGMEYLLSTKGKLRFYKHRVLIPYYDENGIVEWWQGRDLNPKEGSSKHMNLGAVPQGFLNESVLSDFRTKFVFLVEGFTDTISIMECGFPVVGIPGADALKDEWIERFKGVPLVIDALDGDVGGRRSWESYKEKLEGVGCETASLGVGEDDCSALMKKRILKAKIFWFFKSKEERWINDNRSVCAWREI